MTLPLSESMDLTGERRRQQARARRLARRAETLAGEGRVDEAIACQNEVATLRPEDPEAFLRLGLLYREARRIEPAVSALRRALDLSPSERDSREALIETLLEANRFEEAIAEGKALIKVMPRSLFARDVLSLAYLQVGQYEKALHMTREMISIDPMNPNHHFKRAMLFHQQGNFSSAVDGYARTVGMSAPGTDLYTDALEAQEALDNQQIQQIVLLATEDRLFWMKLRRDSLDAVTERGFSLSEDGLLRLRHFAQDHLSDPALDGSPAVVRGGVRFYN